MADHTANSAVHATLSADEEDIVTLDFAGEIVIYNRGNDDIYVRMDGNDALVGGENCHIIPAQTNKHFGTPNPNVHLISSGTPAYSVENV